MADHKLFYYPYASFTNAQVPLLKVAALYFDKLVILDPVGASWDTIGADHIARDAVRLLKDAGILEVVTPATVLAKYEGPIAEGIRQDMADQDFITLCEAETKTRGKERWTLSLAKVPQDIQADQKMRHLMGDFARAVASDSVRYQEQAGASPALYHEYGQSGQAYDEYQEGYDTQVQYRYAQVPLALGEAIMMNHALFAGLLHSDATPITDVPFHNRALSLKLRRAAQNRSIQPLLEDRARTRQLRADQLAVTALTDTQLNLPVLNPALPLAEVLEYRRTHADALSKARNELGLMARTIETEPWSEGFAREVEHKTIPQIARTLIEVAKTRDAWLNNQRGRSAVQASNVLVGAATAALAVFAAPLTPIALATAGLGLVSGAVIPGVEWWLDWRDGKQSTQENGLHYLLKI